MGDLTGLNMGDLTGLNMGDLTGLNMGDLTGLNTGDVTALSTGDVTALSTGDVTGRYWIPNIMRYISPSHIWIRGFIYSHFESEFIVPHLILPYTTAIYFMPRLIPAEGKADC